MVRKRVGRRLCRHGRGGGSRTRSATTGPTGPGPARRRRTSVRVCQAAAAAAVAAASAAAAAALPLPRGRRLPEPTGPPALRRPVRAAKYPDHDTMSDGRPRLPLRSVRRSLWALNSEPGTGGCVCRAGACPCDSEGRSPAPPGSNWLWKGPSVPFQVDTGQAGDSESGSQAAILIFFKAAKIDFFLPRKISALTTFRNRCSLFHCPKWRLTGRSGHPGPGPAFSWRQQPPRTRGTRVRGQPEHALAGHPAQARTARGLRHESCSQRQQGRQRGQRPGAIERSDGAVPRRSVRRWPPTP